MAATRSRFVLHVYPKNKTDLSQEFAMNPWSLLRDTPDSMLKHCFCNEEHLYYKKKTAFEMKNIFRLSEYREK